MTGPAGTVGELGEWRLVDALRERLPQGPAVRLGPVDDAALVDVTDGAVVASTDLLVERRHFRRDWSDAYDIGRKAAAQNLADVTAMGAVPTALLVGLGVPADVTVEWVLQLCDGLRDECDLVGASVAGGDLARSELVVLGVTALGSLHGRAAVTRSGARPGDVVAVAGRLGWSAAGHAVLSRGFRSPRVLVEAHRRPQPPYAAGQQAADLGATAMVDVSDGLIQDLGHVAAASGVRIDLDAAAFDVAQPLYDVAAALGGDPRAWVLAGGEDHALAACFPAGTELPDPWRVVGAVSAGDGVLVDGEPYEGPTGWEAFRS